MNKEKVDFLFEFKDLGLDNSNKFGYFEGYGAIFGNKDLTNDIIEKGAFIETLKKDGMPALLLQHDSEQVIGKFTEAYEDERGLYMKGEINLDVQKAREAHSLLKQGALKGMSIGYLTQDYVYDQTTGIRRLKKLKLLEVSIVTFPANEKAKITGVKFLPKTIREFENWLREAGNFSKKQAKAIASDGWKGFDDTHREDVIDAPLDDRRDADKEAVSLMQSLVQSLKGNTHVKERNQGSSG